MPTEAPAAHGLRRVLHGVGSQDWDRIVTVPPACGLGGEVQGRAALLKARPWRPSLGRQEKSPRPEGISKRGAPAFRMRSPVLRIVLKPANTGQDAYLIGTYIKWAADS